jgi:hypothetical protein
MRRNAQRELGERRGNRETVQRKGLFTQSGDRGRASELQRRPLDAAAPRAAIRRVIELARQRLPLPALFFKALAAVIAALTTRQFSDRSRLSFAETVCSGDPKKQLVFNIRISTEVEINVAVKWDV